MLDLQLVGMNSAHLHKKSASFRFFRPVLEGAGGTGMAAQHRARGVESTCDLC